MADYLTKRVLDVGNCDVDHGAIRRLLEDRFSANVAHADTLDDTLKMLRAESFDLVLVNRKLDRDDGEGIGVLQAIKADPQLKPIPVMLITNYPEYQQTAIASGAIHGFGKRDLHSPATLAKLAAVLSSDP